MSNNKQSSVEWYSNEIGKITPLALSGKMTGLEWKYLQNKALEQAKAMHKEDVCKFAYKCHQRQKVYGDFIIQDYYNEYFNNHETK